MQKSSAHPTHAGELSSAQRGHLMQKSSAFPAHAGELSSIRSFKRARLCLKRLAHTEAQLCKLMQENLVLSAYAEELSSAQ